jgi:predicted DsbA family dithiol-disulfide isomerase
MLYQLKEGTDDEIAGLATASQMDESRFKKCLAEDSDSDSRVESDMADASRLKLRGTPSFAIGTDSGHGRIAIKTFVIGAVDVDVFDKVISGVL